MLTSPSLTRVTRSFRSQVELLLCILAFMWIAEVVDFLLGGALNQFGIHPRTASGLVGSVLAPFLHGGFAHLAANTVPFAVLGWLVLVQGRDEFWGVLLLVWLISGLGVWLFGASNSVHIGASGVIFGFFGFLLFRGILSRSWLPLLIAIAVCIVYGSLIFGVLPLQRGISWEGHLFGFIGGIISARLLAQPRR